LTDNQQKRIVEITKRWAEGGAGRSLPQAIEDMGFLTGVIYDLEEQLRAKNLRS